MGCHEIIQETERGVRYVTVAQNTLMLSVWIGAVIVLVAACLWPLHVRLRREQQAREAAAVRRAQAAVERWRVTPVAPSG